MNKTVTVRTQAHDFRNAESKIRRAVEQAQPGIPSRDYEITSVNLEPVYMMNGNIVYFEVTANVEVYS